METETKAQHTQGPWEATFDRDWRGYMVRDTRGHEIAAVKWPWPPETKHDPDDVMYEANARLIAAAPELLALLEEYRRKALDLPAPTPGSLIERTRTLLARIKGA